MDLMSVIAAVPGIGPVLPYLAALIAICAALAPLLPPPKMPVSGFYPVLYGIVNFVAFNMGHAKNATKPGVNQQ